jgi:hypothetical protein
VVLVTYLFHVDDARRKHTVQFALYGGYPHACFADDFLGIEAPVRA